ncbi:MAG: fibronectin type III domain-containing protein [Candidatus Sumerlaeota bacterium]|nr:fibronectin type III domain-containing protein [Candidatus Sumerlaeota bacterium]
MLLPLVMAALSFRLAMAAAPGAPAWGDPATEPGDLQMTLNWLAASGDPISYQVRYRTSNSAEPYTTITDLPLSPTTYTATGLENHHSYAFEVGAANGSGTTWSAVRHDRPHGISHPSGLHAGGQVDGIVRVSDTILVANADVAGIQRSVDGGETWYQSSLGIPQDTGARAVASATYHSGSGTLYAAAGNDTQGNFYKSTDTGVTWSRVHYGADITVQATGTVYPRSVGKLIAVDPADVNTVYLGTLTGIKKSTNGGQNWSTLALSGVVIRGLVLDGGFLFAAAEGVGVYRVTPAGAATQFTGGANPTNPEEILPLGGSLYVAANTGGIRRLENASAAAADTAWTNLNIGTTTAKWCAIDGYINGSSHILVVGNCAPEERGSSGRYTTVMKCTNAEAASGFNWVNISSAATTTVDIALAAGNGETWWRCDPAKGVGCAASWSKEKRLDGTQFGIDQILINPADTNTIHVVGQMGMWRTKDGGAAWQPAVIGAGLAVHNSVAVDPNHPGYVYVGDTDNGLWCSFDHARSVAYIARPPTGAKPLVRGVDVDGANGDVYVAVGDDPDGAVWRFTPSSKTWTEPAGTDGKSLLDKTSGKTPHGVEVEYPAGSQVILAAVEGSGIWRLAAGGSWVLTGGGPPISSPNDKGTPFAWPSGTSLAYYYDHSTGVWRSTDSGQNWTKIWNKTSGKNSGSLAVPPTDTTKLFVATDSAFYRLDYADTTPVVNNLGVANPAACACGANGALWVTGSASSSGTDDVFLRRSTDWSAFTTYSSAYYQGAAGFAVQLAVEPDFEYTAVSTMGTIVSERPSGSDHSGISSWRDYD